MAEPPAAWAAPGAPAPEATAAIRPAHLRRPEATGDGGTSLRPIALRPLTVLELIDGAIGAVRAVPTALLGWASMLVVALALADFAFTWLFDAAVGAATRVHPVTTTDLFGNTLVQYGRTAGAGTFGVVVVHALMPIVCSGFAVTVMAGLIAQPIKRYVDGATTSTPTAPTPTPASASAPAPTSPPPPPSPTTPPLTPTSPATPTPPTPPTPTHQTRALVTRLLLIAAVTTLPRAILLALYALTTIAVVNDPQGNIGVVMVFLTLIGVPLCLWPTAEWAVAAPVAALEGSSRSGAFAALGRARRLASRGRWRTMWVTLFTLIIATIVVTPLLICQYYIGNVHGVSDLLNGESVASTTYWWLAGYVAVIALTQVLTAPFRAATAVMLYVDRRFRREALDIRIAWARVARSIGNGKGR
jgi:hypothetical protein